jgi:hypothetical protein
MPVTFGYVNNTRIEEVKFDIIDMEFPYNAIIGRGAPNAFKTMMHSAYLCMKIPSNQGIISLHGTQEAIRRAEGTLIELIAIHSIDEDEAQAQKNKSRKKQL